MIDEEAQLRAVLTSAGLILAFIVGGVVQTSQSPAEASTQRYDTLVSIAELVQRESEITREMHMLKFGHTMNLMALQDSERKFEEGEQILINLLSEDFSKTVSELERVSRHRKDHISDFKSNWAIHRNSRSSVLRLPKSILKETDAAVHSVLLERFHSLERDFLVEPDIETYLRTLPIRLASIEEIIHAHASTEGAEFFSAYKRHLKLYIDSRTHLVDAVANSETFSVHPVLESVRNELMAS